jgi:hypothetical protein
MKLFRQFHNGVLRSSPYKHSHRHISWPTLLEKNGHVADVRYICELVRSFMCALALWRRDKGKPAARRGAKPMGLSN